MHNFIYMNSSFFSFCDKYNSEDACIQALFDMRWPNGFVCDKCQSTKAYHLPSHPRVFECAKCGFQHSVTAGTVFHKTRTPLRKWFMASYLIAHDKRGVSALMISRELSIRYETAWLMCHKLRNSLSERENSLLNTYIEVDETFYGGRKQKGNRGRAQSNGKAMIVCAVEKRVIFDKNGKQKKDFVAGNARIAVVPNGTSKELTGFIRDNVEKGTKIISDAFKSYKGLTEYKHFPIVQGAGENAGVHMPTVHKVFSNIKAWLNGTYHGVSIKHLHRYLREWSYRFNRRGVLDTMEQFLLHRAATRPTITYDQLVHG